MKPPLFDYLAPVSVEEAIAARARYQSSALLAGGQSLIPALNFRISHPEAVIDLKGIESLRGVELQGSEIVIGAMARHREVELDEAIFKANPLIRETLGHVAHIVIRNRGTVVGSLAHGDAAAEMPALFLATGGSVTARGPGGSREIAAGELYRFHLTTSLEPDELVTEARIPALPARTGWSFQEFARRRGDYALAGVCALITLEASGACQGARLSACGIASTPVRLVKAEEVLTGTSLETETVNEAGRAACAHVTAPDDNQTTSAFRKQLVQTLVTRTITRALARARARL
ncbi:MAG: FAD binding domain-containing protein [Proteobacteria bacterium]|nr:FAD binding domain-containing protein [Pseudomonadota bacterium]